MWKSILPSIFFYKIKYLYYTNKTIYMAIKIQTYWKTVDAPIEQIKKDIMMCKTQDYMVLYLFKTYGTLTAEDALNIFHDLGGVIKESSLRRSIASLLDNNAITQIGNTIASTNRTVTMYTIVNNPPDVLKSFNKKIPKSISIDLIFDEEGKIDLDKMFDETSKELDKIITKYNL